MARSLPQTLTSPRIRIPLGTKSGSRPSKRFVGRLIVGPRPDDDATPILLMREALTAALVLGSAAAALDLGVVTLKLNGLLPLTYLDLHIHQSWWVVTPIGNGLVMGLTALVVGSLAWALATATGWSKRLGPWVAARRDWGRSAIWSLGGVVAAWGPLSRLDLLDPWAVRILAAGVGLQAARVLVGSDIHRQRRRRWLVVAISLLVGGATSGWGAIESVRRGATIDQNRGAASLTDDPARRPNVVLVVWDTVRADRTTVHGYPRDTTPRLAELAQRGIVFEEARAAAPWTLASHWTMFTGRWPHELGIRFDRPTQNDAATLAELLASRGYRTAGFVANPTYCNRIYGLDRGFQTYVDLPSNQAWTPRVLLRGTRSGWVLLDLLVRLQPSWFQGINAHAPRRSAQHINADALAWARNLRKRQGDRSPFFLFLNHYDAHGPYRPDPSRPLRFAAESPADPLNASPRIIATLKRQGQATPERIAQATRLLSDLYDECLYDLDLALGQLVADLERLGEAERTWIVVTADHGEHFGEHGGLYSHGSSLYREQIHVPLVVIPPAGLVDLPRGLRIAAPVSLRDLPATLLDWSGAPLNDQAATPGVPGRSLARFWNDAPDVLPDDHIYAWHDHHILSGGRSPLPPEHGVWEAVVGPTRTYLKLNQGREALYDLQADPCEAVDLSERPDEVHWLDAFRRLARVIRGRSPSTDPNAPSGQ
ncbi:sulfatase [Isosphaera pallida ATCC 43644]|uniref:Sulfatase n=1 Tax=Isosphaera pallida (strain ATCC 43644 / DSM 9630 / IS1B) TaxID=575540 RepID=E8QZA7_ISOPI|nr:sulfatase [Isosphaera pallida ATCC 43644]